MTPFTTRHMWPIFTAALAGALGTSRLQGGVIAMVVLFIIAARMQENLIWKS